METLLTLLHAFNLAIAWWVVLGTAGGAALLGWDAWRRRREPAPPLRGKASVEAQIARERAAARRAARARAQAALRARWRRLWG